MPSIEITFSDFVANTNLVSMPSQDKPRDSVECWFKKTDTVSSNAYMWIILELFPVLFSSRISSISVQDCSMLSIFVCISPNSSCWWWVSIRKTFFKQSYNFVDTLCFKIIFNYTKVLWSTVNCGMMFCVCTLVRSMRSTNVNISNFQKVFKCPRDIKTFFFGLSQNHRLR